MEVYKFKCKDCGARKYEKVDENTYKCVYCGYTEEVYIDQKRKESEPVEDVSQNIEIEPENKLEYKIPKFSLVKMILCIMFGYVGVHKFMEGRIFMGLIYIFTYGLFGIGYVIDIIRCIFEFVNEYKKFKS